MSGSAAATPAPTTGNYRRDTVGQHRKILGLWDLRGGRSEFAGLLTVSHTSQPTAREKEPAPSKSPAKGWEAVAVSSALCPWDVLIGMPLLTRALDRAP